MDTIFALATAQGRAGVAVVRLSGPQAVASAADFMRDVPRRRGLRQLSDPEGMVLDEPLVLRFDEGASFTGEEVVELHLHGSPAVIAAVLRVLGDHPALRPALPGEFTRRAMENGQLDLAQVEGLADLIDAETEDQRKQAQRVLSGALGDLADGWRQDLLRAAALLEAMIDFADEEVPQDTRPEVIALVRAVQRGMQREYDGVRMAERVRDGFEVAIVGSPNVGKSTLLNRIAGRDAAITSDIAGTTRDVIEVQFDLGGLPVTFLDTAGLRESSDEVEKIGVMRGRKRAEAADVRIHMLLNNEQPIIDVVAGDTVVQAKDDSGSAADRGVSGKTGVGVDAMLEEVSTTLRQRVSTIGVAIRERHRFALGQAVSALSAAIGGLEDDGAMIDLIAEDLRTAVRAVDSLVGRIDVEDVLGEIFSSFCIGK